MKQQPNYTFALTVVIIVCFLLGFVTTMNNSMIDFCKQTFGLTETQGQLVNTAFYGAYILSIPLGILMKKLGYKTTPCFRPCHHRLGLCTQFWWYCNMGRNIEHLLHLPKLHVLRSHRYCIAAIGIKSLCDGTGSSEKVPSV